jgi:hypothetical protein
MAEKKILFKRGTSDKLPASKLANALYFVTDKGQLYLGDDLIADKTGNYADAINNAIAALDATVTDENGLVKVTVVETDGKLTSITVDQTALLEKFDNYKIDEYKNKVDTLIGEDVNKSVRAIANEELAAQLIPEEAKEALDTLTEIAAWIQDHPDDAADMNAAINAIKAEIGNQVSADGQVAATGMYALIQGATRNTVKDCVDSIGALTTQLEWDSF